MNDLTLFLEERHLPELDFPSWAVTAWLLKELYP